MKRALSVLALLLLPVLLKAAAPQVTLSSTHNLAYVGDRIGLTLLVKADGFFEPETVVLDKSGQKYELISEGPLEKRIVPEGVVWEQRFELAFFDLGDFVMGPARIRYQGSEGQAGELASNEVPIKIKGLVTDVDMDLEPGKLPLDLEGSPLYLLKKAWLLFLVILGVLVLIVVLTRKKKPRPQHVSPLSPVQWLEAELKKLGDERLMEKGFQILFALRLTHVLKVFIGRFYRIDAEEMTTEELLARLDGQMPNSSAGDVLGNILQGFDLVKFARYEMNMSEYEAMDSRIRQFTQLHRHEELKRTASDKAGARPHV